MLDVAGSILLPLSKPILGVVSVFASLTTVLPVTLFLVFQRFFLRGAGLGGAVKG